MASDGCVRSGRPAVETLESQASTTALTTQLKNTGIALWAGGIEFADKGAEDGLRAGRLDARCRFPRRSIACRVLRTAQCRVVARPAAQADQHGRDMRVETAYRLLSLLVDATRGRERAIPCSGISAVASGQKKGSSRNSGVASQRRSDGF